MARMTEAQRVAVLTAARDVLAGRALTGPNS